MTTAKATGYGGRRDSRGHSSSRPQTTRDPRPTSRGSDLSAVYCKRFADQFDPVSRFRRRPHPGKGTRPPPTLSPPAWVGGARNAVTSRSQLAAGVASQFLPAAVARTQPPLPANARTDCRRGRPGLARRHRRCQSLLGLLNLCLVYADPDSTSPPEPEPRRLSSPYDSTIRFFFPYQKDPSPASRTRQ